MKIIVFGAAGWLGRAIIMNLSKYHTVRAFDYGPEAWDTWRDIDGDWSDGEIVHGEISDYNVVNLALEGMDAIVHTAVYGGAYSSDNPDPFLVNLKGLWNVLDAARQQNIPRIVHIGSCQTVHPEGVFFTADVRRPDASLYAVTKRLQEEMCRQFHEGHGQSIVVLRPDYIVDSRLGIGKSREPLVNLRNGCVCRHDLAQACHLALTNTAVAFDIFHIVGMPEAATTCNVLRSKEVLGLEYKADLDQYR
jgi:nucleoside-diphosphate-sugar epimerase